MTVAPARLDLDDAGDRRFVIRCRARGHTDETIFFNTALRQINRLISSERDRHRHIVVAAMPKSGSTFLNALLLRATGYGGYLLNTAGHDTERNIDRLSIPMFLARDTVSQEHMRATRPNVELLARMGIRPVVLVRDLLDVLVSARDHALDETAVGPAAHVPPAYASWSVEDQLWFGVRIATPWLLSLYTSWCDASRTLDTVWLRYDEVVGDPADALSRIFSHTGVEVSEERVVDAIDGVDPRRTRYNRGVSGRGRAVLTAAQIETVRAIASVHRDAYDLRPIGL